MACIQERDVLSFKKPFESETLEGLFYFDSIILTLFDDSVTRRDYTVIHEF